MLNILYLGFLYFSITNTKECKFGSFFYFYTLNRNPTVTSAMLEGLKVSQTRNV